MSQDYASGPLGEEAAKLVGAASEWLHRVVADPETAKIANGSPECCWCPVCQLIGTLRGDRPEIAARLAETQTAVAGLLRALADTAGGTRADPAPTPPRVHRIDLDTD